LFTISFVGLTVGVLALTVATAAVSYVVVEQPCQRIGQKKGPRPAVMAPARPPAVDLAGES
jgi:peptidoglycan/LPS O-acetylase OafA/YrhL